MNVLEMIIRYFILALVLVFSAIAWVAAVLISFIYAVVRMMLSRY